MTAAGGAHTAFVHRGRQNQHRMKVTFSRFNVSILSIDHNEKTRSTQDSEPSRLSVTRRFTSVPTLVVSCSFYRLKQSLRWRTRDWRTRTELWSGSSPNCPSETGRTRREEKRDGHLKSVPAFSLHSRYPQKECMYIVFQFTWETWHFLPCRL